MPIFAGTGVKASSDRRKPISCTSAPNWRSARNRIMLDIHQSYQDIQKADLAQELAQADLDLARSQLSVVLAQMNEGARRCSKVEEARFEEDEKWIAFYDAQFNAERARFNVLRQTGELRAALR